MNYLETFVLFIFLQHTTSSFPFYKFERSNTEEFASFENHLVLKPCLKEENLETINKNVDVISYLLGYKFSNDLNTFNGRVKMKFQVWEHDGSATILLHSKGNNLTSFSISKESNLENHNNLLALQIENICYYKNKTDHLLITLNRPFELGLVYSLGIEFDGKSSQGMNGIYISHYSQPSVHTLNADINNDINNETEVIISTHFEPESARQAFPCIDTPNMKAKFTLYLRHSSSLKSYSNMPIDYIDFHNNEEITVFFQESPRMSSYLLAFSINNYSKISKVSNSMNKIKVSVLLPNSMIDEGLFALEVGIKALEQMENLTTIPYALPKLDLIGIPNFAAGAMENWGLITYRMTQIIYKNETVSIREKIFVAETVVHEISHQWFGNLVTMENWQNIWLNEGFATFMEFLVTSILFPEWHIMDEMKYSNSEAGMSGDQLKTTHSISVGKEYTGDIRQLFDHVSYSKAASFLNMLSQIVGKEQFWLAIKKYLETFSFGTTNSYLFAETFIHMSKDKHISDMIFSWILNPGFPVITVNLTNHGEYTDLFLTQQRFILSPDLNTVKLSSKIWMVPISYTMMLNDSNIQQNGFLWFGNQSKHYRLDGNVSWIKLNFEREGFYITNYHLDVWKRFINLLKTNSTILSTMDKVDLCSNAIRLNRNGMLNFEIPMELIKIFMNEDNFYLTRDVLGYLDFIGWEVDIDPLLYAMFRKYFVSFLHHKYYSLKDETQNDLELDFHKMYRIFVVNFTDLIRIINDTVKALCVQYNCHYVVEELLHMFHQWQQNSSVIPPGTLTSVLKAAAMYGDHQDIESIEQNYKSTSNPNLKRKFLHALAFVQDSDLLIRFLNESVFSDFVSNQDLTGFISTVASNKIGKNLTWNFIRENWKAICDKLKDSEEMISELLPAVIGQFKSSEMIDEVREFYLSHKDTIFEKDFTETLEKLKLNTAWYNRNHISIRKFLINTFNSSP